MKLILKSIIIIAAICFAGNIASAQTLNDILGKVVNNSTVSDIVEKVTGVDLLKGDINGTWNYAGSAVKLESEDLVKSTTAGIAATQIEKKLDEFLVKTGLEAGTFSFTFKEDNTFYTTVKEKDFNGTYTLSEDGKTINLKYGKSLSSTGITATAQINAETFELLFKADKFLDLIQKLTDNTTNATLKTLGTLAGQYDGMKIGIELKK
jgi:hypothetical protein